MNAIEGLPLHAAVPGRAVFGETSFPAPVPDTTRIEQYCGVRDDIDCGPGLIPEKHIRESRANDILARLPMVSRLSCCFPGFSNVSPRDARTFVKAVKKGHITHSVCLDICDHQYLFDADPFAQGVKRPGSVREFVKLFSLMADAVIDRKGEALRYALAIEFEQMCDTSSQADWTLSCFTRDIDEAARRLDAHHRFRTFEEYRNRDQDMDFFRTFGDSMDWAYAVVFASRGDITAMRPFENSRAAEAIVTRIVKSSVHWGAVMKSIEAQCRQNIGDLTGCSEELIGGLRTHIVSQTRELMAYFESGKRFTYQQVKIAEHFVQDGLVESGYRHCIRSGGIPDQFRPSADVARFSIGLPRTGFSTGTLSCRGRDSRRPSTSPGNRQGEPTHR